jgi:hypothetical protein
MQPSALSVEPLLILSAVAFVCVVLPFAVAVAVKCRPNVRAIATLLGLIVLVGVSFQLGRMTGLSMAWHHWKREHKGPLWEWQMTMEDYLEARDTNSLVRMTERFGSENIQSYGLEKLFEQGKFRTFVEGLPKSPRSEPTK